MAGPNILSRKRANILSRPSPPPVKFVEEKGKAKSCPFCPETFSTAGDLLRHKNHIHLGILPQECGFCSQDSFRLYGARGHTSYVSCSKYVHNQSFEDFWSSKFIFTFLICPFNFPSNKVSTSLIHLSIY